MAPESGLLNTITHCSTTSHKCGDLAGVTIPDCQAIPPLWNPGKEMCEAAEACRPPWLTGGGSGVEPSSACLRGRHLLSTRHLCPFLLRAQHFVGISGPEPGCPQPSVLSLSLPGLGSTSREGITGLGNFRAVSWPWPRTPVFLDFSMLWCEVWVGKMWAQLS